MQNQINHCVEQAPRLLFDYGMAAFSRAVMDNCSSTMDKHMDGRECAAHMLTHSTAPEGALNIMSALETAIAHSLHSYYFYLQQ